MQGRKEVVEEALGYSAQCRNTVLQLKVLQSKYYLRIE